ncbi:MAG: hypothetical protein ACFB20_00830 [Opitutales bacterium]
MLPTFATYFSQRAEAAHLILGYLALLAACFLLPLVARAEIQRRGLDAPAQAAATEPEQAVLPVATAGRVAQP